MSVAQEAQKDPWLETYVHLLLDAAEQAQNEQVTVATLLYCSALEYLLVPSSSTARGESIVKTLSQRLGAIVAVSDSRSFFKAEKEVKELYDARSKFVHSAKSVPQNTLLNFQRLSRSALLSATRARLAREEDGNWIADWQAHLDHVASGLRIGLPIEARVAILAGLGDEPPSYEPKQ